MKCRIIYTIAMLLVNIMLFLMITKVACPVIVESIEYSDYIDVAMGFWLVFSQAAGIVHITLVVINDWCRYYKQSKAKKNENEE